MSIRRAAWCGALLPVATAAQAGDPMAHAVGNSWSVANDQGRSFDVTLVRAPERRCSQLADDLCLQNFSFYISGLVISRDCAETTVTKASQNCDGRCTETDRDGVSPSMGRVAAKGSVCKGGAWLVS